MKGKGGRQHLGNETTFTNLELLSFLLEHCPANSVQPVIPTPGIRAHLEVLGWALLRSWLSSLCSREAGRRWGTAEMSQKREKLLPKEHGAKTLQCLCKESACATQPQLLAGHPHLGLSEPRQWGLAAIPAPRALAQEWGGCRPPANRMHQV